VTIDIEPEALVHGPLFREEAEISPCYFVERRTILTQLGIGRIIANSEETLPKLRMNAALGITDQDYTHLAGILVQNGLEGELCGLGECLAFIQNNEAWSFYGI
jgi:hypothetical protein